MEGTAGTRVCTPVRVYRMHRKTWGKTGGPATEENGETNGTGGQMTMEGPCSGDLGGGAGGAQLRGRRRQGRGT